MTKKALLSVSDKTGIHDFARALAEMGWEILSTGGTSKVLRSAGISVTDVTEITKHEEIMEGRVKTLHPAVHSGILARRDCEEDLSTMAAYGYEAIDLVAVNLYPFEEAIKDVSITMSAAMAQVDVGGPTMLRSAAKNHKNVWALVDPGDYEMVLSTIQRDDLESVELRQSLASKVFQHLSAYDSCIAEYLSQESAKEIEYPSKLNFTGNLMQELRYGENPSQRGAFYSVGDGGHGLAALKQLQGKPLSYNNFLDLDGALLSLSPFAHSSQPVVCIVKHTTPCGMARGSTVEDAYRGAHGCDPQSAFGSVISVNREIDSSAAEAMSELFVECIVAPSYGSGAMNILAKKKNLRLMISGSNAETTGRVSQSGFDDRGDNAQFLSEYGRRPEPAMFRSIYGGFLVQDPAPIPFYGKVSDKWEVVTEISPTPDEMDDLDFAWSCVFGVKSNAIVLVRSGTTIGIGSGQMSRVDSSRIAVWKANDIGAILEGSVLASDAFFPFRDGIDAAVEAGVRSIIQPGGSIRDQEVINAANEHGISMVFTGSRSFRH